MHDMIPPDLYAFLQSGDVLHYDESASTVGRIRLVGADQLAEAEIEITSDDSDFHGIDPYGFLNGTYHLNVVNLVAESEDYDPIGILVWAPSYQSFGTWDSEHLSLLLFPGTTWKEIATAPTNSTLSH
jgi:hypothetical protein